MLHLVYLSCGVISLNWACSSCRKVKKCLFLQMWDNITLSQLSVSQSVTVDLQFAPTPSHPLLLLSPAMVSATLLNPSKNRLFLHCTNVVSLLQSTHSIGFPCSGSLVWALIKALDKLRMYLGVISNSSEGWYDPVMTSGDTVITRSSGESKSAVTLKDWRIIYLRSVQFTLFSGNVSHLLSPVKKMSKSHVIYMFLPFMWKWGLLDFQQFCSTEFTISVSPCIYLIPGIIKYFQSIKHI